mmetsp:Transcript_22316/g.55000  ORF Transcript_22316/g.55000 Transcript_22316/m.55000 type:complete len:91 (-) Transcript_22316:130-402(-)
MHAKLLTTRHDTTSFIKTEPSHTTHVSLLPPSLHPSKHCMNYITFLPTCRPVRLPPAPVIDVAIVVIPHAAGGNWRGQVGADAADPYERR